MRENNKWKICEICNKIWKTKEWKIRGSNILNEYIDHINIKANVIKHGKFYDYAKVDNLIAQLEIDYEYFNLVGFYKLRKINSLAKKF